MVKAFFGLFFSLLLLAGCASQSVKDRPAIYYPPAPDPPRIQFLMGFSTSQDVEGDEVEYSLISLDKATTKEMKSFAKPYGIAAQGTKVFVADTLAAKVAVIDLKAKSFDWLKGNFGPGALMKPINLTVDSDGVLYVADPIRKKVFTYDAEGNFLRTYGDDVDVVPIDVAADSKRLYVLDKQKAKILVFNKRTGRLKDTLGQTSDVYEERLSLPTNMSINEEGIIYVSNVGHGNVVSLDRDGHALGTIGKMGDMFGQFARPKGLGIDAKRRLFVVDAAHQNVQIFNEDGRLLMFFGDPAPHDGALSLPAGLAITDVDLDFYQQLAAPDFELEEVVMVVSQVGGNKVSIYGFGKKRNYDYDKFYRETEEIHLREFEKMKEEEAKKAERKKK